MNGMFDHVGNILPYQHYSHVMPSRQVTTYEKRIASVSFDLSLGKAVTCTYSRVHSW